MSVKDVVAVNHIADFPYNTFTINISMIKRWLKCLVRRKIQRPALMAIRHRACPMVHRSESLTPNLVTAAHRTRPNRIRTSTHNCNNNPTRKKKTKIEIEWNRTRRRLQIITVHNSRRRFRQLSSAHRNTFPQQKQQKNFHSSTTLSVSMWYSVDRILFFIIIFNTQTHTHTHAHSLAQEEMCTSLNISIYCTAKERKKEMNNLRKIIRNKNLYMLVTI